MENEIMSALGNIGIAGIGFAFAYVLLRHQLESGSKTIAAIDKLCNKIDALIESNYKLQSDNTESANMAAMAYAETKEQYAKIAYRIDALDNKVEDVSKTTLRMFDILNRDLTREQLSINQQ